MRKQGGGVLSQQMLTARLTVKIGEGRAAHVRLSSKLRIFQLGQMKGQRYIMWTNLQLLLLVSLVNCHITVGVAKSDDGSEECPAVFRNKKGCVVDGEVLPYITFCQ